MTTGGRIKALAEERKMNLHQLAVKSGVSYNTVYSIVSRNAKSVKWETLEKLAVALNTTPLYLQGVDNDPGPVLDDEVRKAFISRCAFLDIMLEPGEILSRSGDEEYFKRFIRGERTPTETDLFNTAVDYDISLAYLLGMSDDIHDTTNFDAHTGDPINNALTAFQIRRIMQSVFHQKCYLQDADKIAGLILDVIGKDSIIPLAWAVDAMTAEEKTQMVLWFTTIFDELYIKDGLDNREKMLSIEESREKKPSQDPDDPKTADSNIQK